jgi:hypothetical protein
MSEKSGGAAVAAIAYLLGIALYFFLALHGQWIAALGAAVGLLAVGVVGLAAGERLISTDVVKGVGALDTGWTFCLLSVGSLVQLLLVFVGVTVSQSLAAQSKDVAQVVGAAAIAAVTLAASVFTKQFEASTGAFTPGAAAKSRLKARFGTKFPVNSPAWQAIWEDHLPRAGDVSGWGLKARFARAAIIQAALASPAPSSTLVPPGPLPPQPTRPVQPTQPAQPSDPTQPPKLQP